MPIPFNREYATGRTATWTAKGTLKLHFCGGADVPSGWQGSNFFHPFSPPYLQEHYIDAGPGGWGGVKIRTFNGTSEWLTQVIDRGSATVLKEWANDDAPETVLVHWTSTLQVEEWAYEAHVPGGDRPAWAGGMRKTLRNKPSGDVSTSCTYGSATSSAAVNNPGTQYPGTLPDGNGGPYPDADFEPISSYGWVITAYCNEPFENDLPYPDAIFAEASGLDFEGTHYWWGADGNNFLNLEGGTLPRLSSAFAFRADAPRSDQTYQVYSRPESRFVADGVIRDWKQTLYSIPIAFNLNLPYLFTAKKTIEGGIPVIAGLSKFPDGSTALDHNWLTDHGYNGDDSNAPIYRQSSDWNALSLDRADSLIAETFTRSYPSGYEWTETDCTTSEVSDGLECVASGSTPSISRDLRSDFNDMEADPAAWFTAHMAELDASVLAWWGRGNVEWLRVGKKLRPDSDVFNWNSYRYAYLEAKADADCTVTLTVEWDELTISGNIDDGFLLTRAPKTVDYEISLTTTLAEHEIDLPSAVQAGGERVGHFGLRYVRSVAYAFPSGRTVIFNQLELREKERPIIDVHHPWFASASLASQPDIGILGARGDGKMILYDPRSRWGWAGKQLYGAGEWAQSLLMDQFAEEISLQEGWTASVESGPATEDENYTVWLREIFNEALPATLRAGRGYGGFAAYPRSNYTLGIEANLGHAVAGLIFDPDTDEPENVPVRAETPPPGSYANLTAFLAVNVTTLDEETSKADGRFQLELTTPGNFELRSSPGTADAVVYPTPVNPGTGLIAQPTASDSRTWWPAAFSGKNAHGAGSGPAILDIDRLGNEWVAYVPNSGDYAGKVTQAVKLGVNDRQYYPVQPGSNPWVKINETHPQSLAFVAFESDGAIVQVSSKDNGRTWDSLKTITDDGTHPTIAIQKATGLYLYTFYRGGSIYLKRSDDGGDTFKEAEIEVLTGVSAGAAPLDFAPDGSLVIAYSDGTNILTKTSTDNGATWS